MERRTLLRLSQRLKLPSSTRRHLPFAPIRHDSSSSRKPAYKQANPIGDYYAAILSASTPQISSSPPTVASPSNPPITFSSKPSSSSTETKTTPPPEPSILFSSRLSSPLERRSEIARKSRVVAGVLVPPRPSEPDNCCMSGCVNCVWDRYRDEVEEWAAATKEADKALRSRESSEAASNMDDDGGGSEGNWDFGVGGKVPEGEDLFGSVPVGIREFMAQEKRLKEKHAREGTVGG
ncbi:Oxidoreductase protein [Rutstroemia sp. NJR-2017a BBW]|nr:Oxidoreductase protein [Rutstroemia sp. NJR-2017a BBW]